MSALDPTPDPPPEPPQPPRRGRAVWPLALAIAWLLASLPFLLVAAVERLPQTADQLAAAAASPRAERLRRTIAVTAEVERLLRERLGADGRLVVFCPYPGEVFVALLRLQYERLKNLLYPTPRDARFARSAAELDAALEPRFEGRLVVVDGTQEPAELPVAAEFELLAEQPLGRTGRLRYWLLREVSR